MRRGLESMKLFRGDGVEGDNGATAATFRSVGRVAFVRKKVPERSQKESPKLAFSGIDSLEITPFQKAHEKRLGEILRVGFIMAFAANESVDGIPICAAKLFQRRGFLR